MNRLMFTTMMAIASVAAIAADATPANVAEIQAKVNALAKEAAPKTNRLTRAEIEQRPQVLRKTGGFIDVESKGTAVVVLDCRAKAGGAPAQFAEVFGRLSKTNVKVERAELKAGETALAALQRVQGATRAIFALAVYESEQDMGLTIHPEARIALVNAAKYRQGQDPLQREVRVVKELWRGLGFVSGLGYAPFKNDVFQPIYSVPELDALEYQVMQPMNFQKMYNTLGRFGVKRARHIPYRLAVMEGWAAAPTNEYQKAIWEQVKSEKEKGPSNPMTIKKK